ncbi:MAG: hypothetical protein NTZ17_02200 [Phycisphaerae bacterium]|nr:hypothetical protein [Phycisphaerae bacterium]
MMHSAFFTLMLLTAVTANPGSSYPQAREIDDLLYKAIRDVDPQAVRTHLENGANPNYALPPTPASPRGLSMLSLAAAVGSFRDESECLKVLALLVQHGAALQPCDGAILYSPVLDGRRLTAEFLLGKGADPNARSEGLAMIEWAYAYGQKEVATLLTEFRII